MLHLLKVAQRQKKEKKERKEKKVVLNAYLRFNESHIETI